MSRIFQFKISLKDVRPKIWRIIEVPKDYTFDRFNIVILNTMGWKGNHLYRFNVPNPNTGLDDVITGSHCVEPHMKDSVILDTTVTLFEYFSFYNRIATHDYDFGSGWCHDIIFEKDLTVDARVQYPRCIKGSLACPPENCGGPWIYNDFLKARIKSKVKHEELQNIPEDFDSEKFDINEVNERLRVH